MGFRWIDQVVQTLQVTGIRADRGYPAAAMPEPSEPVAAVSVENRTEDATTLAVMLYTTAAQGGIACEDAAMIAYEKLAALGAACSMGSCGFNGRTGLFSVRVLAQFQEQLDYPVKVNDKALAYLVNFSAEKTVGLTNDSEGNIVSTNAGWQLTMTQLLPADVELNTDTAESFSVTVERPGGAEQYPNCYWEKLTVEDTPAGLRRVQVARTWSDKVVAVG